MPAVLTLEPDTAVKVLPLTELPRFTLPLMMPALSKVLPAPVVADPWNPMRPVMVPVLLRLACAKDGHVHIAGVDDVADTAGSVLHHQRLSAETKDGTDIDQALDRPARLVVDVDGVSAGRVVAQHHARRRQAQATIDGGIDRALVAHCNAVTAQAHRTAANDRRHAEHCTGLDIQRHAIDAVGQRIGIGAGRAGHRVRPPADAPAVAVAASR
ncbi:hypothetical protein G6F68_014321 [Rhizopus microsporus]|nr:hypothetical protein G6F68_014321 [Rhizopus microsporus]